MIHIDFQGGAHGNFLEFVCNVVANVKTSGDPFNTAGALHNKKYLSPKIFHADHYSFRDTPLIYDHVISIKIEVDDLLQLSQISLLRAGDYGYDNDVLEFDTYNKFNNKEYRWVLDTILNSFFTNQIQNSYNAVKDPTWPDIHNLAEFWQLPEHIRKECIDVHNLELLELSNTLPDCPRHILREFFQIGFENPLNHGFMTQQLLMKYDQDTKTYNFPFAAFYDTQHFLHQLKMIASWAEIEYSNEQRIINLHTKFLELQPYKDSRIKCDHIVQQLLGNLKVLPKLNLIEEAYVNAMLKRHGHERRYRH